MLVMSRFSNRRVPRTRQEPPAPSAKTRDEGFSLVEVVMAITLISIIIIPIIEATFTSVKASSTARIVAEVDTTLQNAADRVTRAPTLCEYDRYVQAALIAKGWEASQVTAIYEHYVPGTSLKAVDGTPGQWVAGGCIGSTRTPRLIQKVTITVSSDQGSVQRTIEVVKSDV